jgi:hypothetical protein
VTTAKFTIQQHNSVSNMSLLGNIAENFGASSTGENFPVKNAKCYFYLWRILKDKVNKTILHILDEL